MGLRDERHNSRVTNVILSQVTPDTDRTSWVAQYGMNGNVYTDGKGVNQDGDEEGIPQEACVG